MSTVSLQLYCANCAVDVSDPRVNLLNTSFDILDLIIKMMLNYKIIVANIQ